jgi:hypothetical protein
MARARLPVPLWDGQDFSALHRGLDRYSSDPSADFQTLADFKLNLYTLSDAYFAIGTGVDGLILNADGAKIEEPSCFTDLRIVRDGFDLLSLGLPLYDLDEVFVGFDGAYKNYFHFLCFALARCHAALPHLPASCQIVMPRYEARPEGFTYGFRRGAYDQAIALSGMADRLSFLPAGIYRARTLRFLWTLPRQPTDFLEAPAFYDMFADIRSKLSYDDATPRRILLSRAATAEPRLRPETVRLVNGMCQEKGFTVLRFEDLDFIEQATLMYNADCIIAPHGAGLVNILFARDDLRILELGSELDGDGSVRASFYQMAANRGQPYRVLNDSRGEVNADTLSRALAFLRGS